MGSPLQVSAGMAADLERLLSRVRREHAMIRTLLDDVDRACTLALATGAGERATRLRKTVWDLYLVFDEHLAMEEAHIAPLLRAGGAVGEKRAVDMVLEHNEQRRVMLELVEDAERDQKALGELVRAAQALVAAFRIDMETEESTLSVVFARPG